MQSEDEEHLRLLSIFYYVMGGLTGLCAFFPIFHLIIGVIIASGAIQAPKGGDAPPEVIGWIFIAFAVIFIVLGWACALSMIVTGRCLQRRTGYIYCQVMAGFSCMNMPFGTVLGILTFIVLARPSVKARFGRAGGKLEDQGWDHA